MAPSRIIPVLGLCLILTQTAEGYSTGSTRAACDDMRPQHGVPAQVTPSPYTIRASKTTYSSREEISVTVSGNDVIAGVLIEAVSTDKSRHVGYFRDQDNTGLKTVRCGQGDAITNSKRLSVNSLTVIWTAPTQTVGDVVMTATVVKDLYTFWIKIESSVLTEVLPTLPPQYSTPSPGGSTGPGYPGVCTPEDEGFGLAAISSESFTVKWTYIPCTTPPEVEFEITADISDAGFGKTWIAIGFSKDELMGDDSVVECVQTQSSDVTFRISYNQPNTKNNIVIPGINIGLTPLGASTSNGKFTCRFRRAVSVPTDYRIFDLSARTYRLLLARGPVLGNDIKIVHSIQYKKGPVVSTKFIDFSKSGHLRTLK